MVLRLTCLASAVMALSAGVTAAAQTPAPPAPQAAENSEDIYLRADVVTEDQANAIMTAEGNVEVRVGQRTLKTDKLIYDEGKGTMRAQGRVEITDIDGSVQFSDEVEVDEDFRNGFATRFSARLAGNAMVTASSAVRTDGTRNALEQVVYTGCPVCEAEGNEPTWSIRARRAEQNTETQTISYQDAVFEIKGVPVLYLPWFAHPDPTSERRSGFIVASKPIGVSSKLGAFVEAPYYWAISPSQEMTIAPMISQNVNPLVKVDYRKRFFSGFVDFQTSFTHEQEFNSDGDKDGADKWRGHIYGGGRFNIDQDWQWGFGVERQSDDLYDQRYDIDGEDDLRGIVASQPRQLISQLYTTGQHDDFYFEAAAFVFQGLREGDIDDEFPTVAPSLFVQKLFDLGANGTITTDFSAVGLFRNLPEILPNDDVTLDTARVTANVEWKAQYVFGPGLVFSPYLQGRGDFYRFDRFDEIVTTPPTRLGTEEIGRALGVAGAQLSYPFIRRGENVDVIVEPIAMIAYGSDGANDDGIPNEDSQLFEGDDSNLLDPNPITTYDLWEGGGRTALGVSTTVKAGDDTEVSALVARRWRQEEDPAFNDLSNLANETSDYVASVKADLGRVLNAGIRLRMDDDFNVNRIDVSASANVWRASAGARYFKISETPANQEDEGLVWNGTLKISDRWSAIVEQSRNITLGENIRLSIGIGYRDDCSFFGLFYQRDGGRDRDLGPSESIRFNFVLTGLGGLSDADVD
jgi:LPS-assembly protein